MENSLNCITFACRKDRCQIITAINMEVRLNKFLSDSGLCSRREADKFIEMGRVTVNGSFPTIGQKVTEADIIQVDEETIPWGKRIQGRTIQASTPPSLAICCASAVFILKIPLTFFQLHRPRLVAVNHAALTFTGGRNQHLFDDLRQCLCI